MPRYIDADKLIEALQTDFEKEGAKADDMAMSGNADLSVKYSHGQFCYLNAIERIKDVPTAEVVPKSEVDLYRKQVDELEDELASTYDKLENAKQEVAREIFADVNMQIIPYSTDIYIKGEELIIIPKSDYNAILAKLKKKYTE